VSLVVRLLLIANGVTLIATGLIVAGLGRCVCQPLTDPYRRRRLGARGRAAVAVELVPLPPFGSSARHVASAPSRTLRQFLAPVQSRSGAGEG
jgi:hypothetical protein